MNTRIYTLALTLSLLFIAASSFAQDSLYLAGHIKSDYGRPMVDAKVTIARLGPIIDPNDPRTFLKDSVLTDANGYYQFDTLLAGDFSITVEKYTHPLNGVSTEDVTLISREILLLIDVLNPVTRLYAADITRSGYITTFDLVQLLKQLLGLSQTIQPGWGFLDAQFIPTIGPFSPIQLPPSIYTVNSPIDTVDFYVYKIGDVNGSAALNLFTDTEDRSGSPTVWLQMEDQFLEAGQEYRLPLNVEAQQAWSGYQFALQYDPADVEVLGLEKGAAAFEETHTNINGAEGWMRVLGFGAEAKEVTVGTSVVDLKIRARRAGWLSAVLSFEEGALAAEVYDADLNAQRLGLQFAAPALKEVQFFPAYPNPFTTHASLRFYLPEASIAKLLLYDATGRMISEVQKSYDAGYQEFSISKEGLPKNQFLYYRLEVAGQQATGKLLRQ